jgi:hypothetical protein
MRKLVIGIFMIFSFTSMASAELGVNIGISGNLAVFAADASETTKENKMAVAGTNVQTEKNDETAVAGYTSIFIEKTLGFLPGPLSRLSVGFDHVPSGLSSDTTENARVDLDAGGIKSASKLNKVQVEFNDLNTLYLTAQVTDNLYVKLGKVSVDLQTNESLATGSKYADTSLDGSMYGIGYNRELGPLFLRLEGTMMDLGGASLTSSTNAENSVKMNNLEGASAKFSIGKSF